MPFHKEQLFHAQTDMGGGNTPEFPRIPEFLTPDSLAKRFESLFEEASLEGSHLGVGRYDEYGYIDSRRYSGRSVFDKATGKSVATYSQAEPSTDANYTSKYLKRKITLINPSYGGEYVAVAIEIFGMTDTSLDQTHIDAYEDGEPVSYLFFIQDKSGGTFMGTNTINDISESRQTKLKLALGL